ncbi:MAG: hypothetical protein C5B56_09635 [Proteobacteria bacterium]|nr:MAG: hypothetical protein C5B56_09635 [Pseudomonadota bacterium]
MLQARSNVTNSKFSQVDAVDRWLEVCTSPDRHVLLCEKTEAPRNAKPQQPLSWGFSLVEVIIVIAVASVIAAIAIIQIGNLLPGMRADSGANQVLRAVRQARHSAIAARRTTQINFIGNHQIQLLQLPAGGGVAVPLTGPTPLEGGAQFVVFPAPGLRVANLAANGGNTRQQGRPTWSSAQQVKGSQGVRQRPLRPVTRLVRANVTVRRTCT